MPPESAANSTEEGKLTDEGRELVAANIRLAYWAVGRLPRLVEMLGVQEAESLACLALCEAARDYRPALGELSTCVMRYVKTELIRAVTASRRKKRGGGRKPLPLDVARHRGVRDAEPAEPCGWLARGMDRLDRDDREILRLWAGYEGDPLTDEQIGRRLGWNRTTVSQWRRRALAVLRAVAEAEGGGA